MSAAAELRGLGRILLLGGGNMGGAMLRGWLEAGLDPDGVTLADPNPSEAMAPLFSRGVGHVSHIAEAGPQDIAILAVKPQVLDAALADIGTAIGDATLVISVAAGRTVASIEERVGGCAVVRAMPNTPALIGRGITGAFANPRVGERQRAAAAALLGASGPVEWVATEAEIDAVTAVSGSGPAYVFLLAEALAEAGAKAGLDPDLAMRLARHTVAGAGELMIRAEEAPAQLRRNVTSPKGTTEAALSVLMDKTDGMVPLLARAVEAARRRAEELAKG